MSLFKNLIEELKDLASKLEDWAAVQKRGAEGPSSAKLRRYASQLRDVIKKMNITDFQEGE